MKKILNVLFFVACILFFGAGIYSAYVAHMNKMQHDRVQNATNDSVTTNVVAEADTNVRVLKFTVRMHLTNEVPARPTNNGTNGR